MEIDGHIQAGGGLQDRRELGSSRNRSPMVPQIIVPTNPSSLTARPSSAAAASGTPSGSVANAENRSGCALTIW